jgi:hypothetical protein
MKAVDILEHAIVSIQSRARNRDVDEERSMDKAVQIFKLISGVSLPEYHGWLFMVALKLARNANARLNEDDLVDCAAYCALALECATESLDGHRD